MYLRAGAGREEKLHTVIIRRVSVPNTVGRNDLEGVPWSLTQTIGDVVYEQTQEKFDLASFKSVADFIGDG